MLLSMAFSFNKIRQNTFCKSFACLRKRQEASILEQSTFCYLDRVFIVSDF